jgi:2-polyprenyl-6-methoxyphenol hydroxylase-like FAD-dependent oxidoreductase
MEIGYDCATLRGGVWAPRTRDKNPMLCASRVLIEAVVRELLRKIGKVQFIERTNAIGFEIARDARTRVTGVKVRSLDGGAEATIATNLVVDASGRTTKIPSWLREIGLPEPEVTIVDPHTGYATRWFRAVPERRPREWWWKSIVIDTPEDEVATTGLFPVEENKFTVTMAGVGGKYPPNDGEQFTQKLSELRSPIIAEEVALAEPISPVYSYRNMANRWRRYDRWKGDLGGFVALGDSTCAFNPVYGQGMTTCAVGALMLGEIIKRIGPHDPELPRQFFHRQAAFQAGPWGLATGADFRFPTTHGERPTLGRLLAPVFGRLWDIQRHDDVLRERINMVLPPSALLTPPMLARIAFAIAKVKIQGNSSATVFAPTPPTNELAAA